MLPRTRRIVATAQDCGRFESSALPSSQTPQCSAASPHHRVLSAHSFRPHPPTSPGSGRKERAVASASTSQAEPSTSFGTPCPTDRAFLPSRSFSGVKRPSGMHFSPEKCGGGPLALTLPPIPARVRHASEGATFFQIHPPNNRNKVYGTQTK